MTEQRTGDARGMDTAAPTGRLQRLLAAVRLFDRRHPYGWDVTATLFWVAAALTDYASSGWRRVAQNLDVSDTQLIVLSLGFTVPLLWRRRHPMAVLAVTAPFALLNSWSGAVFQAHLVQLVPVFGLALHRPLKQLIPAFLVVVLPIVPGALRYPLAAWDAAMGPAVWGFALTALLGIAVRSRRERLASLEERARRLEVERDQQAQLAAAAERTRIAREMHDIIGHNLSVITGLADGGKYAAGKSPERAAQALDAIGTTSRQALGELRRLLDRLDRPGRGHERHRSGPYDGATAPIRMPGMDGIEATRRIVAAGDRTRVLILTTFDLDEYAHAGLRAGASGFLVKDAQPEELLSGIRAVATGDAVVAPSLTRRLLDAYAQHLPAGDTEEEPTPDDPRLTTLTEREREILTVIGKGWTNTEIAARFHLAESTVKTHVGRILAKTGSRDRFQAVILAYDAKLVEPA
ncbi:histidine kinase [Streptomyces sp. NPDC057092]|uniref:histidine kinase n=1 Tax=Streptomyces sp. NPDC057092 TaxID=3346017 RepID=UPI0036358FDA